MFRISITVTVSRFRRSSFFITWRLTAPRDFKFLRSNALSLTIRLQTVPKGDAWMARQTADLTKSCLAQ
jgi:hypothetical protein